MPGKNLTRVEAEERAALVSVQAYAVELDLTTSDRTFATTSTLTFTATAGGSTFVDFIGASSGLYLAHGFDRVEPLPAS